MKRRILIWVMVGLLPAAALAQQLTAQQWQQDIDYALSLLRKRHPHLPPAARMDSIVQSLKIKAQRGSVIEMRMGLESLGAAVGDGHTWISDRFVGQPYRLAPLVLRSYPDGIYVIGARAAARHALGSTLTHINGLPVQQVSAALQRYIPQQENSHFVNYWLDYWLRNMDALVQSGIALHTDSLRYTLKDSLGRSQILVVQATTGPVADWVWAYTPAPFFMTRAQEKIWIHYFATQASFYIKVNGYPNKKEMGAITNQIVQELTRTQPLKIIFDLRANGGGDKKMVEQLIDALAAQGWRTKARVFALSGDHTFSAAAANLVYLKEKLGTVLVGEPPTNRPNFYAENHFATLPNSKIAVSVATQQVRLGQDGATEMQLDHPMPRDYRAYSRGQDPLLRWVFAQ